MFDALRFVGRARDVYVFEVVDHCQTTDCSDTVPLLLVYFSSAPICQCCDIDEFTCNQVL